MRALAAGAGAAGGWRSPRRGPRASGAWSVATRLSGPCVRAREGHGNASHDTKTGCGREPVPPAPRRSSAPGRGSTGA